MKKTLPASFALLVLTLLPAALPASSSEPVAPPRARLSLEFPVSLAAGQLELRPYPSRREKGAFFLAGTEIEPTLVLPLDRAQQSPSFELPMGFWQISYRRDGERRVELPLTPFKADRDAGKLPSSAGTFALQIVDEEDLPIEGALVGLQSQPAGDTSWQVAACRRESDAKGWVRLPFAAGFLLWVRAPGFAPLAEHVRQGEPPRRIVLQRRSWSRLQVRDLYRRPLPDALVSSAAGVPIGFTDADGELEGPFAEKESVLVVNAKNQLWSEEIFKTFGGKLRAQAGKSEPLRGEVIDRQTGELLPGAWVWLEYAKDSWTQTDSYGQFEIYDLFREPSDLRADAPHYSLGFAPAERRHRATLRLLPADRVLYGKVSDLTGEPIAGAEVHLRGAGRRSKWTATTDSEGDYRLSALPAEQFQAEAVKMPFFPLEKNVDTSLPAVRLDFELERGGRVLGQVVSERDVALPMVRVLEDADGEEGTADPGLLGLTDPDGLFEIGPLRAGKHLLIFEREGYGRLALEATLARGQDELDFGKLELAEEEPWIGRVVDESGVPLPEAKIYAWMSPRFDLETPPLRVADAVSGEDGRFELEGFRENELIQLEIRVEDRPPVLKRTGISRATNDRDWEVPAGARFSVVVRDPQQEPVFFAQVAFTCDGPCKPLESARVTDEAGRAHFPPLPAGEIQLEVKSEDFGIWRRKIELEAGRDRTFIVLMGDQGTALEGRIFAAAGQPAAGYVVTLGIPSEQFASTRIDAEGFYRLEGLPEGSLDFSVSAPGSGIALHQQKVKLDLPQNQLDLQLPKRRLRTLGVVVLGSDGRPLPGVEVTITRQGAPAGAASTSRRTDAEGIVIFRHVPEDQYLVLAAAPDATFKSASAGIRLDKPLSDLALVLEKTP